eukprot:2101176-Amphidinium_carterae.1
MCSLSRLWHIRGMLGHCHRDHDYSARQSRCRSLEQAPERCFSEQVCETPRRECSTTKARRAHDCCCCCGCGCYCRRSLLAVAVIVVDVVVVVVVVVAVVVVVVVAAAVSRVFSIAAGWQFRSLRELSAATSEVTQDTQRANQLDHNEIRKIAKPFLKMEMNKLIIKTNFWSRKLLSLI